MDVLECYMMVNSIKRHFGTQSYDYYKYNGKVIFKGDLQKNRDYYNYAKLAKQRTKRDLELLCLANFKKNAKTIVANLSDQHKIDMLRNIESITYVVDQDCKSIEDNIVSLIKAGNKGRDTCDFFLMLWLEDKISTESYVMIDGMFDLYKGVIKKHVEDNYVIDMVNGINKYRPFLKRLIDYDRQSTRLKTCISNSIRNHPVAG